MYNAGSMSSFTGTPLELRQWRREGQRSLRLLFNELAKSIDAWKKMLARGKYVMTDMTNLALESSTLEDTLAGLGQGVPQGTHELLTTRYVSKLSALQCQLNDMVTELKDIYRDLENAYGDFEGLVGKDASMEDPRADVVLCTALSYRDVCRMADEIVVMYGKELKTKIQVVDDVSQACSLIFSQYQKERGFWHVHITAWMMNVYVSQETIDQYMTDIASDAGMPYTRR